MPASLEQLAQAFNAQTDNLVRWIDFLGADLAGHAEEPSSLDGWSVRDLVVHVGACLDALIRTREVPEGTVPFSLAEYLGTYPNRAEEIDQKTRAVSEQLTQPLPEFIAQQVASARSVIARFDTDREIVVQAQRAPISARDLVASRLIEVVVHSIDLVRSLKGRIDMAGPLNPLDRNAVLVAGQELLDIVITRGGFALEIADAELWVSLAAGRLPYNTQDLASAIRPAYTAGGVPDLGKMLPVL